MKDILKDIKAIVTDIDGVLTDGSVCIDNYGQELFGKYQIVDGMGVRLANECGLIVVALSGRKSSCHEVRCRDIGVKIVYTGINDKADYLTKISQELSIDLRHFAYIGDDIIDLKAMNLVGFSAAPGNACSIVKQQANYVTSACGGGGALRELIELILINQDKYFAHINKFYM